MTRPQRDPPRRFFERSEFRRLASFSFLLVILAMIIADSRGPGTLRWLVGRSGKQDQVVGKIDSGAVDQTERVAGRVDANSAIPAAADKSLAKQPALASAASSANPMAASNKSDASAAATKSIPPASGVTDKDPDEAAAAEEDLQYVEDGSTSTLREEMPAYERILRWVVDQPYARLAARSKLSAINHSQIVAAAGDERGRLLQFDLHVRRVTKYDSPTKFFDRDEDPHAPVQLYEMWGNTDESRGHLYQLVVFDPPAGMPIGPDVREDVRFVGYFFKLQGYEPAKALPGAPLEIAPTFIGRVLWMERPPMVGMQQSDIWWLAAVCGGLLIALVGWVAWLLMRQTRPTAPMPAHLSVPRAASIDEWLENTDSPHDRDSSQNQDAEPAGSSSDRATFQGIVTGAEPTGVDRTDQGPQVHSNGHSNGHATRFSDGPDGQES